MIIDSTFWVAISFGIFLILLIYFKIPVKVKNILDDNISQIKKQIDQAEKLKEEAKNKLAEQEKKMANASLEIKSMIEKANEESEKKTVQSTKNFTNLMNIRKKNAEEKINQMRNQAIKDIKNASVNIALESIQKMMINSLDKNALDKIYKQSIEETKLALQKKSS